MRVLLHTPPNMGKKFVPISEHEFDIIFSIRGFCAKICQLYHENVKFLKLSFSWQNIFWV